MTKAPMEIEHAEQATDIGFGVENTGPVDYFYLMS